MRSAATGKRGTRRFVSVADKGLTLDAARKSDEKRTFRHCGRDETQKAKFENRRGRGYTPYVTESVCKRLSRLRLRAILRVRVGSKEAGT